MNLIQILSFIVKFKVRKLIQPQNTDEHIFKILGAALSFTYALQFSVVYDHLIENTHFTSDELTRYFYALVVFFTIFIGFFPIYLPKTSIVPILLPVNTFKRIIIEVFHLLAKTYFLFVAFFLITINIFSTHFSWIHLGTGTCCVLIGFFIRESIKMLIEKNISQKLMYVIFLLMLSILFYWSISKLSAIFSPIAVFIFFGFYYLIEKRTSGHLSEVRNTAFTSNIRNIYISLILNNSKVRNLSGLYLFLKALFLSIIIITAYAYPQKTYEFTVFSILLITIISPVSLSAFLNNTFGIYRNLWLCWENNSTGSFLSLIKVYFLIAAPFLLVDGAITFVYFIFSIDFIFFYLIFYIFSVIVVLVAGLISSVFFPKKIAQNFQYGYLSSITMSFVSYLGVAILLLPSVNNLFYLSYGFLVLLLVGFLQYVFFRYPEKKYSIYLKLFKN